MHESHFEKYTSIDGLAWGPDSILLTPGSRGVMSKLASQVHTPPELLSVIDRLTPRPEGVYALINALGAYEYWGCFTAGTLVLMGDGTEKAIQEIRPGDLVRTHTGAVRRVVNLQIRSDKRKKIRFRVEGLDRVIETTEEHPFLAHSGDHACLSDTHKRCLPPTQGTQAICVRAASLARGCVGTALQMERAWVRAGDLAVGDWLTYVFPKMTEDARSLAEYRLLGLFLAEGSFIKYGPSTEQVGVAHSLELNFGIHEETTLAAEAVDLAAACGWSAKTYVREARSTTRVDVRCGRAYAERLREEVGEYSYGKRVPVDLFSASADAKLAFVAGLLDGDGCFNIHGKENRCVMRLASRTLTRGVQQIIWSLGAPCSLTEVHYPTPMARSQAAQERHHYQLSFPLSRLPRLAEFSSRYKFRSLQQATKARGFSHDGAAYLPIREIETVEDDRPVYNLEVEEDHSYVAGGVTVHNCNRNGDAFPEWALLGQAPPDDVKTVITRWNEDPKNKDRQRVIPAPDSYGYKTFATNAHPFILHANKDPLKTTGEVIAAAYNHHMHRVELIVFIYEARDPEGVKALREERPVAWSMGARVPWDRCSICSNLAKNRSEYCPDLLQRMKQVLPDGRVVCMVNDFPKFFDISRVLTPADQSAWTLRKIASTAVYDIKAPIKRAAFKAGAIEKNTPPEKGDSLGSEPIDPRLLTFLKTQVACDRDTTDTVVDPQLSSAVRQEGLRKVLSALALAGIVLKGDELAGLQRIRGEEVPDSLDLRGAPVKLLTVIRARLPERSLVDPMFSERRTERGPQNGAAAKTASAPTADYRRYLKVLADSLPEVVKEAASARTRVALEPDFMGACLMKIGSRQRTSRDWLPFMAAVAFGLYA